MKVTRRCQVDLPLTGLSCPPGSGVKGMQFVYQPLVEWICRVDIDTVSSDDVIVLEPNAADSRLAGVRLEVKRHALFQNHGSVLGRGAEVRRLPGIDARAVAQAIQHVGIGRGENLRIGRARTHLPSGVE